MTRLRSIWFEGSGIGVITFATVDSFRDFLDVRRTRQIEGRAMAELSRIRGADTEEQLLELQRAFLASEESRASPAARVQRVGGAPPRPPTADEAAGIVSGPPTESDPGAATAIARDPQPRDRGTAPPLPTELRDVVTEVLERRVGETAPRCPLPARARTSAPSSELRVVRRLGLVVRILVAVRGRFVVVHRWLGRPLS